jgi:triosephosphate isomerase
MKPLIIGTNLKMYKGVQETLDYLGGLRQATSDIEDRDMCLFVIPSYLALHAASMAFKSCPLLGAQNMHWEDSGQFTGEISPVMLKQIGISIAEIGHSERRQLFGETDETVNKKVLAALKHGMRPLICIGETAEDKARGITCEKLRLQAKVALQGVSEDAAGRIWMAYEPVWAIGVQGVPAEPGYASLSHKVIHDVLEELYPTAGKGIPVLYGGSVNMANARELIVEPYIDGLFIGRSAWQAEAFDKLIREVLPLWRGKQA